MNLAHPTIALLCLAALTAQAQYVKGNEAVRILPGGSKRIETPPTTHALLPKPCAAASPGCLGGGWRMVETPEGLMECTEIYARPTTCRASTYGAQKRSRLWIVKTGGQWMHCSYPDLNQDCVSTKSLPSPAVQ
ncbi:hypothetical protein [Paucibacter sp. DJ2R-2]|uniref:hypothetical protein n=1 Tax=Paucibacter sp. DJ2R-2 TaxID=2893558 RepID=UPI0021E4DE5B|nr:hypothetical protein [Paucibacter sp. DJ2R-2]MCV2438584.1 hypothetical protein [Paucibacter sp. DJ2R-2]